MDILDWITALGAVAAAVASLFFPMRPYTDASDKGTMKNESQNPWRWLKQSFRVKD
jgi:hypothetical protein